MQLVMLSGGVGGARMARGLCTTHEAAITLVVNVADDDLIHGLSVSADLDTVTYTLAGMEGPEGWGRSGESWSVMEELSRFPGADTSFRLGDLDLAVNLYRSGRLAAGHSLSEVTADICRGLGIEVDVLPASDDPVRTIITIDDGDIDFQTYFVRRRHRDPIRKVTFRGAETATPAPGVTEAIAASDVVMIGPSNPVLSVWPILAVPGIRRAIEAVSTVVAVSPLIAGKAVKGPAVDAMRACGLSADLDGIAAAYDGLLTHLVIDDRETSRPPPGLEILRTDTMIADPGAATRLAGEILGWLR